MNILLNVFHTFIKYIYHQENKYGRNIKNIIKESQRTFETDIYPSEKSNLINKILVIKDVSPENGD